MKALRNAIERTLRGPRVSRMLARLGIDPRRFWLLMDLFAQLSGRGEQTDQLGRQTIALKMGAWLYGGLAALMAVALIFSGAPPLLYGAVFLALTAVLLFTMLASEASNSLLNPAEAQVLAHQPIGGATYTAAKLLHLLRIVLYMTLAVDGVAALGSLFLPASRWFYPPVHLAAAFVTGLMAAAMTCAAFGWLMRFVPAKRLRAAGQIAVMAPMLIAVAGRRGAIVLRYMARVVLIPLPAGARWLVIAVAGVTALALVAAGLRSLSADYLIRVSVLMHGARKAAARGRRPSSTGAIVAHLLGGPAARAGFCYVRTMMLRDWQFRRQLLPAAAMLPMWIAGAAGGVWRSDPFGQKFAAMHLLPHILGALMFMVCNVLPYGSDYKGAWVFLLAGERALRSFARGIWALLFAAFIVIPHALLFPVMVWKWGPAHAVGFTLYSVAAAAVYLGMTLRLVDGVPFGQQVDPKRGATMLPLMMGGTVAVGIAVVFQYLLFRWPAAVAAATVALAFAGLFLTRATLESFAVAIRFRLSIERTETTSLFQEIPA